MHPLKRMRAEYSTTGNYNGNPAGMLHSKRIKRDQVYSMMISPATTVRATQTASSSPSPQDYQQNAMGNHMCNRMQRIVSPDEIRQIRHVTAPSSMPPPPFVSKQQSHQQRPQKPKSQNPLEMLSAISTHVAETESAALSTSPITAPARSEESYVGMRNPMGHRHGKGIMKYSNGCRYVGMFLNDKRHGFGKCWYPNGCMYTGFWVDGKRDGLGKMMYIGGHVYEGEWKCDRRHGRGVYYWEDGVAEVCRYACHDIVGEGAQFSPCRRFVNRLVNGKSVGRMSMEEAMKITSRIGLPGVPKQAFSF